MTARHVRLDVHTNAVNAGSPARETGSPATPPVGRTVRRRQTAAARGVARTSRSEGVVVSVVEPTMDGTALPVSSDLRVSVSRPRRTYRTKTSVAPATVSSILTNGFRTHHLPPPTYHRYPQIDLCATASSRRELAYSVREKVDRTVAGSVLWRLVLLTWLPTVSLGRLLLWLMLLPASSTELLTTLLLAAHRLERRQAPVDGLE